MAPDPPSSPPVVYYGTTTGWTNTWTANNTDWIAYGYYPIYHWERLVRRHWREMSEAERVAYRHQNAEPTLKGIRLCSLIHERLLLLLKTLPNLQARFDRRIPCWRAGRWKSLTA